MTQKRGLGRGLSDLGLDELLSEMKPPTSDSALDSESEFKRISVDLLQPGRYQPRRQISQEALEELAQSIREQGIIQPIVVRPLGHHFEIIAGERRWRAAQLVGLKEVPVWIREISDETAIALSLIENIQRQDLNVIEEAMALERLLNEFSMTHEAVAQAVGKSRATVTNLLRLLKLNAEVRALVEEGQLEMGHARALLALEEKRQSEVAEVIVAKALSVREAEKLIRSQQSGERPSISSSTDPDIKKLQNDLSEKLGAEILIRHSPKGKGKLIIHYNSSDELAGILERIK